jgi:hypothetical protein
MHAVRTQPRSPRGIWRALYDQDGYPVIIAVDSRGRKVAEIVLMRGLNPSDVRRTLTEILDAVDPKILLRLHRST